jgi:hypothetical protein
MLGALLIGAFAVGASLYAQDPFGAADPAPAAAKQDPEVEAQDADKNGADTAPPTKAAPAAEAPPDPSKYSLPVRAIVESDPQSPQQLIRASSVLVDLGEPALAKPYIARLKAAALDDAAMSDLVRRLGSGPFLKIAGAAELAPDGREFADRAIAAVSRAARDPARLQELVNQLGDPSAEVQRQALVDLRSAHEFAVNPLLAVLNDPAKRALHGRAREALVALGDDAIQPLLAVLDGPDSPAKLSAVNVLGRLQATEATPRLAALFVLPSTNETLRRAAEQVLFDAHGKTPNTREATQYLASEIEKTLAGERPLKVNVDGAVDLWVWDAAEKQPIHVTYSIDQARSYLAAGLARRLVELSPANAAHRPLYIVSLLSAEAYRVGLDNEVPRDKGSAFSIAADMSAQDVESALSYALAHDHAAGAAVAAQILGEIGSAELLVRAGAEPSPLAAALTHRDRRLRFAAAQAIVALKPTRPFPGLSHLEAALVYFSTSAGTRKALIGFPNIETARNLAGMVNALGFDTETATNGRELLLKATKSGGNELVLISSRIDRAPLYLVLQDLRNHAHTGQTPMVLLAEDDELGDLRERIKADLLTSAALRPRDLEGMKYAVEQAMRRAGDRIIPPAVRDRQAQQSLVAISELSKAAPKIFDFRADESQLAPLLYVPLLSREAADVLSQFGTHTSQRSLLEIVNRTSQPAPSRQAAALAFGESVHRFGLRLTKNEIVAQYDRYNQSELEDQATQELLAAVLDTIELRSKVDRETTTGGPR